jgi:phosphoglycerate dehydrogenase-like enzyme
MTRLRCAILDDYQNVGLQMADWSQLADRVEVTVFNAPFADAGAAMAALADFDIVCAMRERTPFPAEVLNALPKLKLLLTSGMRNASFDLEAAKARGVTICGAGDRPDAGIDAQDRF